MVVVTLVNIFSSHLLALINNVSVWWHVAGAAIVILICVFGPKSHQSFSFVFTERINNSGFGDGTTSGLTFWLYVLPLGFLLTQYTITGYDASAHLSEETQGAANGAAKGIWQSIFYSAIGGWILLLSFLFAATNLDVINSTDPRSTRTGPAPHSRSSTAPSGRDCSRPSSSSAWRGSSSARPLHDLDVADAVRLQPGRRRARALGYWAKVNANGTPRNAVLIGAIAGVVLTLPALYRAPNGAPVAFYAVVSIGVIGLYGAFAIPIWFRWRAGDSFTPGSVDARQPLQVDVHGRGRRDRHHVRSTSCCRSPRPAGRGTRTSPGRR